MNHTLCFKVGSAGLLLGAALLVASTGCVRYAERPHARNVYVEPGPVFIEQDEYVYYPRYQMYYGNYSHHYYYQDGPAWVARPAPRGVSASVLFASPSVTLDFHDRPSAHHAEVIRSYPKNWKPSGANPGHREDRRENNQR